MITTSIEPGTILAGKFRVERVLGMGAMGMVLCAQHLVLEKLVAIKLMLPEYAHRPEVVQRFMREAQAAARIKSEHVVGVTDVGCLESGEPFMVMELLSGQDLQQYLESEGPLAIPEAVDYVLQVIEAVAEAHAAGIVHRDLKPANMFLTRRRNGTACVKVLDFGISKLIGAAACSGLVSTHGILGSPLYMSPEQLRSSTDVDGRSDIWSLGVVLFQLLTGEFPFDGGNLPVICVRVLGEDPASLRMFRPEVALELETAILRCLEKKREDRFASVADFASAIAPFGPIESVPLTSAPSSRPSKAEAPLEPALSTLASFGNMQPPVLVPRSRRKLGWVAIASVCVGATAAAAGIPYIFPSRPQQASGIADWEAIPEVLAGSFALEEHGRICAASSPSVTLEDTAQRTAVFASTHSAKQQSEPSPSNSAAEEAVVETVEQSMSVVLPVKRDPLAMEVK